MNLPGIGKRMIVNTDIDIDIADRKKLLQCIPHTPAMMNSKGKEQKHNTGVYFHKVPVNPFTQNCTVDFKKAEELGYFKLDILNVNVYDGINDIDELNELLDMEPMWELLEHEDVVKKCFHIHNHFPVVRRMKPKSVEQLAAVLAVIRPAKRYLLDKSWQEIMQDVWIKPDGDEYYFKKAHAHAYALAIVLQLNMMVKENRSSLID